MAGRISARIDEAARTHGGRNAGDVQKEAHDILHTYKHASGI